MNPVSRLLSLLRCLLCSGTWQGVDLHKGCADVSGSPGPSLLIKSGPHWLDLKPAALPLTIIIIIIISSSVLTTAAAAESSTLSVQAHQAPAVKVRHDLAMIATLQPAVLLQSS
jgi:hypothetical protein